MTKDKQKKPEIGIVIKRDILENQVNTVYIGIGSNLNSKLGSRVKLIELAKSRLLENGIKIIRCSSYYESLSWPNKNKPKFLNIVLKIETKLNPLNLFKIFLKIEKELGRRRIRGKKNKPRTCDIDIIDYNQKMMSFKSSKFDLNIPHSKAHERNFVLLPLFEISSSWKHPYFKIKITDLLFRLNISDLKTIKKI